MENSWHNCKLQVSSRQWVLLFLRFKVKEQPWSNILLLSLQREGAREEDNHKVIGAVYMLGWSVCCVHSFHWSKAYHRAEPNMNGLGWEYIIHDRERRVKICIHQFNVPQSAAKKTTIQGKEFSTRITCRAQKIKAWTWQDWIHVHFYFYYFLL